VAGWILPAADGVRLRLKVAPRAARDAILGLRAEPDGERLAVQVTAAPEDGRANAALLRLLAKRSGVPAGRLRIVAGAAGRRKTVAAEGAPDALAAAFATLAAKP
jgi:hypothetical protein